MHNLLYHARTRTHTHMHMHTHMHTRHLVHFIKSTDKIMPIIGTHLRTVVAHSPFQCRGVPQGAQVVVQVARTRQIVLQIEVSDSPRGRRQAYKLMCACTHKYNVNTIHVCSPPTYLQLSYAHSMQACLRP